VGRGTALATVPPAEKGALLVPTIALVAGARYVPNLHFVHTVSQRIDSLFRLDRLFYFTLELFLLALCRQHALDARTFCIHLGR
jgi:hypothetical protein